MAGKKKVRLISKITRASPKGVMNISNLIPVLSSLLMLTLFLNIDFFPQYNIILLLIRKNPFLACSSSHGKSLFQVTISIHFVNIIYHFMQTDILYSQKTLSEIFEISYLIKPSKFLSLNHKGYKLCVISMQKNQNILQSTSLTYSSAQTNESNRSAPNLTFI